MKVVIDPAWSMLDALEEARKAYVGWGITSTGYRNSVLMNWGSVVGKGRALREVHELVEEHGSKKALARSLHLSPYSLRKIEKYFIQLPDDMQPAPPPTQGPMVRGAQLDLEEDIEHELKEVKGKDPVRSIRDTVDQYAVAFLNSQGGRILWGVTDVERTVVGVGLATAQRDRLRREIGQKLVGIQPAVDPTAFGLYLHPALSHGRQVGDLYVVEVTVPKSDSGRLHFTAGGEAWVRVEGAKQKLRGPAIQDWIVRRLRLEASGPTIIIP